MYPNIDEFTEHGQTVIGYIEPIGGVAIASEDDRPLAMLRRRKGETFKQLLARLDTAIEKAPSTISTFFDEVNTRKTDTHLLRPVVSTSIDHGHIRSHRHKAHPSPRRRTSRLHLKHDAMDETPCRSRTKHP